MPPFKKHYLFLVLITIITPFIQANPPGKQEQAIERWKKSLIQSFQPAPINPEGKKLPSLRKKSLRDLVKHGHLTLDHLKPDVILFAKDPEKLRFLANTYKEIPFYQKPRKLLLELLLNDKLPAAIFKLIATDYEDQGFYAQLLTDFINQVKGLSFEKRTICRTACRYLFFMAIVQGNVSLAQFLITNGTRIEPLAYLINGSRRGLDTPMHVATQHGQLDIIRLLINNNAHVEALNLRNETPQKIAEKLLNKTHNPIFRDIIKEIQRGAILAQNAPKYSEERSFRNDITVRRSCSVAQYRNPPDDSDVNIQSEYFRNPLRNNNNNDLIDSDSDSTESELEEVIQTITPPSLNPIQHLHHLATAFAVYLAKKTKKS